MALTSPFWLIGLVPWAALAIYLLLGQRQRANVPFVAFWRGPVQAPQSKRSLTRVPAWIALLLLASAVAIVAASGPAYVGDAAPPIEPSRSVARAGIESLVVRKNQCMVRVMSDSTASPTELAIE